MPNVQVAKYVSLHTPFDREFLDAIGAVEGSSFDFNLKCWMVLAEKLQEARLIASQHFGSDGINFDQVRLHISLRAGAEVETEYKAVLLDGWSLNYLSYHTLKLSELVKLDRVESFKRRIAPGNWKIGFRASVDADGIIVLDGIGRWRAERVLANFREGKLEAHWSGMIQSIWIESLNSLI